MNRRSFLKNSIGALLYSAISNNKILSSVVESLPQKSLDVLLYAVQTKCGDWKVKATKWINLNSEKLKKSEFDNSQIKKEQTKFAKQYAAVRSLHSVDHHQCTINGKNYPISKQASFSSRSKGGNTRVIENKESGYWIRITEKYSSDNGKKNIKHTKTKYAILAQKNSASYIIEQLKNNNVVKTWYGTRSFNNTEFTYKSVKAHIKTKTIYKGYFWRYKKITNKNHRKSIWDIDMIKDAALLCSNKAEFKRNYQQAYYKAKEFNIFDEVTKHMKRPKAKNQYTR
jgi:hypothetical protein